MDRVNYSFIFVLLCVTWFYWILSNLIVKLILIHLGLIFPTLHSIVMGQRVNQAYTFAGRREVRGERSPEFDFRFVIMHEHFSFYCQSNFEKGPCNLLLIWIKPSLSVSLCLRNMPFTSSPLKKKKHLCHNLDSCCSFSFKSHLSFLFRFSKRL